MAGIAAVRVVDGQRLLADIGDVGDLEVAVGGADQPPLALGAEADRLTVLEADLVRSPALASHRIEAGFRFGHSQVRGIYNLNDNVVNRHIFMPGPLPDDPNLHDLRGFRKPPAGWAARWDLFFEIGGSVPQPSRKIDTRLVPQLFELPDGAGSLPLRNLLRGEALGLPSGQAIARFVGVDELDPTTLQPAPVPTPLWFYILREADVMSNGRHLGPVGARIVGEVLLGLLELDPQSWYSVDRTWTPEREGIIPIADRASDVQESVDRPHIKGLRMADLVAFVSG